MICANELFTRFTPQSLCSKSYYSVVQLQPTSNQHRVEFKIEMSKKHFCTPCNKEFKDQSKLKRHLEDSGIHNPSAKHECETCHSFFMSKDGLRQHVRVIHEKKKIRRRDCPLCEKSYCDGKGLKNHLASVHDQGEKSHKCEFCGLAFMFLTQMNRHVRFTHKKDMAKFCKFCDKGFSTNAPLKKH